MTPLLTLAITIVSIALAAACWAVMCGVIFGRFDDHRSDTWWGSESWELKYLNGSGGPISAEWLFSNHKKGEVVPINLRNGAGSHFILPKWYYDFCKLKYIERFPFSATVLVFTTDLFHLAQWFAIKFICLAIAVNTDAILAYFFLCWLIWGLGFNIIYLRLK